MFPTCLKICSSNDLLSDRKNFINNHEKKAEKKACMHTCSEKFSQSEKVCSLAVQNHQHYIKTILLPQKLKLEEEKKIESLINKHF